MIFLEKSDDRAAAPYAHIKVVVAFLVVNFGGFLVIARNPRDEF